MLSNPTNEGLFEKQKKDNKVTNNLTKEVTINPKIYNT